jgi:hypothetical protein
MCTMVSRRVGGRLLARLCGAWGLDHVAGAKFASAASCVASMLPKEIVGVRIPDSDLARAATMLVQAESPPFLFNHCMRTFVLADLYARHYAWKYDEELVFISSALHDLGLVEKYENANMTFEQAGASYAQFFVLGGGFSPDRADRVWKGIAWHAGGAGPAEKPDIRLIQEGARLDVFGDGDFGEIVPPDVMTAILAVLPRCRFKLAFKAALAAHAERQPDHATWTKKFREDPPPPIVQAVLKSPWPE